MWLDLKRCAFAIFAITMFILLTVQPAFSLESSFISNGNSTIGVPTSGSYADWMNDVNSEILDSSMIFEERPDPNTDEYDRVVLHPNSIINTDNICLVAKNFEMTFMIPSGTDFAFEVIVHRSTSIQLSNISIKVMPEGRSAHIDKNTLRPDSGTETGDFSFYLVNEPNKIGITRIRPNDSDGWFDGESKDHTIKIEGYFSSTLKFYVLFKTPST